MTIAEKIQQAIIAQQREVERIQIIASDGLAAAQDRLDNLLKIQTIITPRLEASFTLMKSYGIRFDD